MSFGKFTSYFQFFCNVSLPFTRTYGTCYDIYIYIYTHTHTHTYIDTHTHTQHFAYLATPSSSLYLINIYLRPSDLCYDLFLYLCCSWRSLHSKWVSLKSEIIIKKRWKLRWSDIAYLTLFNELSLWHCKFSISCFSSHSMLKTIKKSATC
jgi:hypothetical protein